MTGWMAACALSATACGGSGTQDSAQQCTPSGSFTETVVDTGSQFCDGGGEPDSVDVAVGWSADGSVTLNGEACTALCPVDGGTAPCAELGLPVNPEVNGVCRVVATCSTGSISAASFYTNVGTHSIEFVRQGTCMYQVPSR
jgi:hypothetical protein